jgi:hypothetical protein
MTTRVVSFHPPPGGPYSPAVDTCGARWRSDLFPSIPGYRPAPGRERLTNLRFGFSGACPDQALACRSQAGSAGRLTFQSIGCGSPRARDGVDRFRHRYGQPMSADRRTTKPCRPPTPCAARHQAVVQGGEAARLHTCASVRARPPGGRGLPSASAPRRPTRSAAERPPRRRPPAGAVDRVPHHPTLPRAAAAAAAGRRPRAVPPHPTRARQPRQGLRPSCRHRGAIFMRAVRSASSPPAPAHGTSIGNTGGRSIVNNAVVLWAPPTRMPPSPQLRTQDHPARDGAR